MLGRLADELDMWYDSQHKGKGTRISVVEKPDAAWLIVRHGGTYKRENALENGEPKMVFYRPETYDLLIYYYKQGELAIYNESNGSGERRAYCTYLGKVMFGNDEFFQKDDVAKFTLEPCAPRDATPWIARTSRKSNPPVFTNCVTVSRDNNNHSVTHAAEDVFAGSEDLARQFPMIAG